MGTSPSFLAKTSFWHNLAGRLWTETGRLGLLNGLLIGLALAAGLWLLPAISLVRVPVPPITYAVLAIGALLVVTVAALAGWITALLKRAWANGLIWIIASALISLLIAYQSYGLPTHLLWLVEPALSGRQIYPAPDWTTAGIILSGFFIFLVLALLALLQGYRLDGIKGERSEAGRLTGAAWLRLLLPLPFVVLAGILTGNFYSGQFAPRAFQVVQEGISTARAYEGDLFELQRETGFGYGALRGVRGQLGDSYTLFLAEANQETGITTISVHFDNGAWINCRLIHDQLNFCYDASPPYTRGFSALITGHQPPEECRNCEVIVSDEWQRWLAQRRPLLGARPQIEFVRQRGSYVLMRAEADDGATAIECWFSGISPIRLDSCQEIRP